MIVNDADRACLFWESTVHLRVLDIVQTIHFLRESERSGYWRVHTIHIIILSTTLRFFALRELSKAAISKAAAVTEFRMDSILERTRTMHYGSPRYTGFGREAKR